MISFLRFLWPGCRIVVSGILFRYVVFKFFNSRRTELNNNLSDLCSRSHFSVFVPQFLNARQMKNDGIHPTFDGACFLAKRIVSVLEGRALPPLVKPSVSSVFPSSPSVYPKQVYPSYKAALISTQKPGYNPNLAHSLKKCPPEYHSIMEKRQRFSFMSQAKFLETLV